MNFVLQRVRTLVRTVLADTQSVSDVRGQSVLAAGARRPDVRMVAPAIRGRVVSAHVMNMLVTIQEETVTKFIYVFI
jgi:hypothetical protein